jgi:hypothetical protein
MSFIGCALDYYYSLCIITSVVDKERPHNQRRFTMIGKIAFNYPNEYWERARGIINAYYESGGEHSSLKRGYGDVDYPDPWDQKFIVTIEDIVHHCEETGDTKLDLEICMLVTFMVENGDVDGEMPMSFYEVAIAGKEFIDEIIREMNAQWLHKKMMAMDSIGAQKVDGHPTHSFNLIEG